MRIMSPCRQVYQLQMDLQKAQTETEFHKRCSRRCLLHAEAPQLQEEVRSLRCQLVKVEKLNPVRMEAELHHLPGRGGEEPPSSGRVFQARQDILAQDLADALDSQVELAEQLRGYREENEKLLAEKQTVSPFPRKQEVVHEPQLRNTCSTAGTEHTGVNR